MLNIVTKVWGREEWIVNNDQYGGKRMILILRAKSSLHRHPLKRETFFVVKGELVLEVGTEVMTLKPNDAYTIEPGILHRFTSDLGATFYEFSTSHDDNDVERVEESEGPPR